MTTPHTPPAALLDVAAIEAHGVQSADDALAMADAILDPENDGVEWLMRHGCDVMDHLRAEVRSLRAHVASEPERVAAAVAAETQRCIDACAHVASQCPAEDERDLALTCAEAIAVDAPGAIASRGAP